MILLQPGTELVYVFVGFVNGDSVPLAQEDQAADGGTDDGDVEGVAGSGHQNHGMFACFLATKSVGKDGRSWMQMVYSGSS